MTLPADAELFNPSVRRGPFAAAVFDFDGTVSLIREGWAAIMAVMGVELLRDQNLLTVPEAEALHSLEDAVLRLSGKPSIFQMRRLAEEVVARGGVAPDPDEMLKDFLARLLKTSGKRCDELATGTASPEDWAVAGTHALLRNLQARGVKLLLASGTDLIFVQTEAELLQLTGFFAPHIYAPADNTPKFSKGDVFDRIVRDLGIPGEQILSFGDGYAETVEAKRVGAVAVGVASRERGEAGVNQLKRAMLAELGADVIVPDYREQDQLVRWLFGE